MSDDNDDKVTTDTTFTRSQVRSMIAAEVRKVTERFADYDDLKTKADAADKDKGKLDKVLEKLELAEKRAADAEAATLRRDVADELGLSARQAGRLKGTTKAELLEDGRGLIEDMGYDPDTYKADKAKHAAGKNGSNDEDDKGTDDADQQDDADKDEGKQQTPPATTRRRPTETLRSGAPATREKVESDNPLDLVKDIPRG